MPTASALLALAALAALVADGFTPSQSGAYRARRPLLVCEACGHSTRSPRHSARHAARCSHGDS